MLVGPAAPVCVGSKFIVKEVKAEDIRYNRQIQMLCRTPYRGHKNGCPNYGIKPGCPPDSPLISEVLDLERGNLFALVTEYNVGEFAERMLGMHPNWQNRMGQCYNIIRWQGNERRLHAVDSKKFLHEHEGLISDEYPEARGVNITNLLLTIGIRLRWARPWPPKHNISNKVYRVSLAGYPKAGGDIPQCGVISCACAMSCPSRANRSHGAIHVRP